MATNNCAILHALHGTFLSTRCVGPALNRWCCWCGLDVGVAELKNEQLEHKRWTLNSWRAKSIRPTDIQVRRWVSNSPTTNSAMATFVLLIVWTENHLTEFTVSRLLESWQTNLSSWDPSCNPSTSIKLWQPQMTIYLSTSRWYHDAKYWFLRTIATILDSMDLSRCNTKFILCNFLKTQRTTDEMKTARV